MADIKKKNTIAYIKERMTVPEEIKEKSKIYIRTKRLVESALQTGPKTIPQIAKEINQPVATVTYYVMSLHKFGLLEAGETEGDYYLYYLPKN